jgi:alpha-D-ribose 1-methylphosphonate 5-triphosphate synthase subunit PhnG
MNMTDNDGNNEMQTPAARRQRLMRICTQATVAELERALADCGGIPAAEDVRPAEEGLIMIRGRIGGTGAAFNLGEATVTRAVIRLSDGTLGYSYLLGRAPEKARLAAMVDALGQDESWRERLDAALVAPVSERRMAEQRHRRAETEATRVNFFTLVRGED